MSTLKSNMPPARITKADYSLQAKVGSGPLDPETVKKCQDVIDNFDEDFAPEAGKYLESLKQAIKNTRENNVSVTQALDALTTPVMQLKANASTFRYGLIGNLANIMLNFLESVTTIDADVLDIVEAHQKTIGIIVLKQLKGDGGATGKKMEEELQEVCKRYFSKRRK